MKRLVMVALCAMACGGGGGSSPPQDPVPPTPPPADIVGRWTGAATWDRTGATHALQITINSQTPTTDGGGYVLGPCVFTLQAECSASGVVRGTGVQIMLVYPQPPTLTTCDYVLTGTVDSVGAISGRFVTGGGSACRSTDPGSLFESGSFTLTRAP